jgi:hypothetical protein
MIWHEAAAIDSLWEPLCLGLYRRKNMASAAMPVVSMPDGQKPYLQIDQGHHRI